MSKTKSQSRLDSEPWLSLITEQIKTGDTNMGIARLVNREADDEHFTSPDAIRRFRRRHQLNPSVFEKAQVDIEGDKGTVTTPPTVDGVLQDPDQMIRDRGLDPEEWIISDNGFRVNQYEGPAPKGADDAKITYYQTRFNIERRVPESQIKVARSDGWKAPPRVRRLRHGQPKLVVVVGDQQAPFYDQQLHTLFCNWLRKNKPDEGVSLGDSVDLPDIRPGHRLDPENNAIVNECLQSGYDMFRGYVDSSPNTWWRKLIGNHDERLRNILLDTPNARPLYKMRRPIGPDGSGGEELHSLSHAMRLDELGIDVIDPHGAYDLAQIKLSDKVAVKHGWIAQKGAGASALATLRHLGYSVLMGHTHRQSIVHDTKHEIGGSLRVLKAVETGCMCRVDQTPDEDGRIWPNYAVAPDWQQGFATVELWDNGFFQVDLATYVNGTLIWRDQIYSV